MDKTVCDIVREAEKSDEFGFTQISKHVQFRMRETLETIDAYANSKHISGDTDSMGREKPFFNIVTAAINVYMRATDLDRKHIRVKATKAEHYILAFLATILLQNWMTKENFGKWLNTWGKTLSKYGSAVSKFVDKGDEMSAQVIPWSRLLVDAVNINSNVVIEKIWLTADQLKSNKSYDQEIVKDLLDNPASRENHQGQKVDNLDNFFLVYEVHGMLPRALLMKEDEIKNIDWEEYSQQMHVVSFQGGNNSDSEDYTLYKGPETKHPYHLAHLIEEEGRTLSIGAVEHLFEAQWMVNHSQKQIKDQLDLASKMLFQTADGNFLGQNALTNIENGQILIHAPNSPLTQLNNRADIQAMQANSGTWQQQGSIINGIGEAMLGEAPKSGTAWRQTEAILAESHSLFEQMTENKGIAIEEILREFVLPHLKKKLDTSDEINALLEEQQIDQLDQMYVPNEAKRRVNEIIKETILSGQIYDPSQQSAEIANQEQLLRESLAPLKNQRFIKPSEIKTETWKKVLKDLEWELEVDITGEVKDTQASMATLTTVFQTLVSNPGALQDKNVKMVFSRILEMSSGISPVEVSSNQQSTPQMAQVVPQMAGEAMNALTPA